MPCRPGEGSRVSARFLGSGLPNYELAELVTSEGSVSRMTGPAWRPSAETEFSPGEESIIRVTGRDGQVHQSAFTMTLQDVDIETAAMWPDTPRGVWWVVIGFGLLMLGSIIVWLGMIIRVARERS